MSLLQAALFQSAGPPPRTPRDLSPSPSQALRSRRWGRVRLAGATSPLPSGARPPTKLRRHLLWPAVCLALTFTFTFTLASRPLASDHRAQQRLGPGPCKMLQQGSDLFPHVNSIPGQRRSEGRVCSASATRARATHLGPRGRAERPPSKSNVDNFKVSPENDEEKNGAAPRGPKTVWRRRCGQRNLLQSTSSRTIDHLRNSLPRSTATFFRMRSQVPKNHLPQSWEPSRPLKHAG